jgi:AcrR family transcriptional regulator
MVSTVGRPKEHDEHTATALLEAAERTVEEEGVDALSVRGVAAEVGTTTRAIYSLFGSKDGLVVALGARGFEMLGAAVAALPVTDDAGADLIAAGLEFRRFAVEHPALFAISVRELWPQIRGAAMSALEVLRARIERLDAAGGLRGRSVLDVQWQFHALCEGLASVELRTPDARPDFDEVWRTGIAALIAGLAVAPGGDQRSRAR